MFTTYTLVTSKPMNYTSTSNIQDKDIQQYLKVFKITGVHLQYVQSNTLIVRKLYTFSVCRILVDCSILWWKISTWNADTYQILTKTFNRIRLRTTPQGTDLRFPGHGPVYGRQGVFLYSCSHTGFVFFFFVNKQKLGCFSGGLFKQLYTHA